VRDLLAANLLPTETGAVSPVSLAWVGPPRRRDHPTDPGGMKGGLALLWQNSTEVEIINYSARHISARVYLRGSNFQWKFTGFYGNLNRGSHEDA